MKTVKEREKAKEEDQEGKKKSWHCYARKIGAEQGNAF